MISNVKQHVVSLAGGRTFARLVMVIRVPEFIKGSRLSVFAGGHTEKPPRDMTLFSVILSK